MYSKVINCILLVTYGWATAQPYLIDIELYVVDDSLKRKVMS